MLIRFKRSDGTEYPQWEEQRLDNISNIEKGQQISEENIDKNGCYYHLNGGINPSNRTNLYNREANTISISEGGNSCGYVKWNSEKFFSGGHNYTLQNISKHLQDKYLYYFLKNIEGNIMKLRVGGALPNIQKKDISKVLIRIPCLEEQQKIADFLSTVDQKIDKQKAIVTDYEDLKKGTMQKIFNQEIRFKDDGGNEFPEWEEKTLGDIFEFINGKAHEKDIDENGKYVVVNSKFISTEGTVRKYSVEQICPLKKNDIVMVMSDVPNGKAMSKCFLIDEDNKYTLNQRICALRTNMNVYFFLYQISRNKYFIKFDDGVNQTNLKKDDVLNCPLLVPSLKEQKKIADCLSALDRKIEAEKKILADLEELKKGLLQSIFNN